MDIECVLEKPAANDDDDSDDMSSDGDDEENRFWDGSTKIEKHVPIAVGYLLVAHPDVADKAPDHLAKCQYRQFTGRDCIQQALKALEEDGRAIYKIFQ